MTKSPPSPVIRQHTLKNAIHCSGFGRDQGAKVSMTLRPAPTDVGIVFARVDLPQRPWVSATWENAAVADACTGVVNDEGIGVCGVEHLMSALYGCAIDNVVIELDGPEVPAMDGSAAPFVFLLECAGAVEQSAARRALKIRERVAIDGAEGAISLAPGHGLTLHVASESECAAIGRQELRLAVDGPTYKREVSRARHFDFLDPDEERDVIASPLDNAVIVQGDSIVDERGLRYGDEFVRHQTQEVIGDLYLAGGPVIGQASARRAGRELTVRLLEKLFADASAWSWIELCAADLTAPLEAAEPPPPAAAAGG
jgi:UDP-3-O-[3-hydroxymyristoyl] N-acetylglucosamine deacetylase